MEVVQIMKKRIKDILTSDELEEVHKLNKSIMGSTSKKEIQDYKEEIDYIIDKAKERYFHFFDVVEKHVNQWDLMDLLSLGAPDDEYEDEIKRIASSLPQIQNESDLASKIKEIFDHSFGSDFSYDKCSYIAQIIWMDFSRGNMLE